MGGGMVDEEEGGGVRDVVGRVVAGGGVEVLTEVQAGQCQTL